MVLLIDNSQGTSNLRRYFLLIIFQAYLRTVQPDTARSYDTFEAFVKDRPGTCLKRMLWQ